MSQHYRVEDIVWGKVDGYPWWPAQVVDIKPDQQGNIYTVTVNFIGDDCHCSLPVRKVADYDSYYAKYSVPSRCCPSSMRTRLVYSVVCANRILARARTFEGTAACNDSHQ